MKLLDFIFPKRCLGCGKIGRYFCDTCSKAIQIIADNEKICPMCGRLALDGITHPGCKTPYGLDGLTSFFHYEGIIQKAIKAIKYRFISDLASEFISLVPTNQIPQGVLIPIPLHPSRLRFRGFNQAEELGKFFGLPMRTDLITRTKKTVPQVEMSDKKQRLENMKNVFVAEGKVDSVLLFDDVFTTGATMRAATMVLKRAGAKTVWGMTMAR